MTKINNHKQSALIENISNLNQSILWLSKKNIALITNEIGKNYLDESEIKLLGLLIE